MTSELQRCVAEYERQAAADAATADHSLLADGLAAFERLPPDRRLATENVRAAVRIFSRLRKRAETVDLLTEYLEQDLETDDEEWARWERTDNLALMRRFEETVEAQRDDYAWAKERLEPHRWLRVMYDGTQALAWWGSGKLDEWLGIVYELRATVPVDERTRESWFHLNRTEVVVLEHDERIDHALAAADRVVALADRFPEWDMAEMVRVEGDLTRMSVLTRAGRGEEFDAAADRVIARLAEFPATRTVAPGGPNQYVVLCHNAAARLYSAKRYERAARLFREAARGKAPYLTYIFLAACVWADAKDRREVMDCLREAAKRDPSGSVWQRAQKLPELADLADDAEVKAAAEGT
ncbi:MAG: hypothetical protein OXG79_05570 [Chloroflexi bacterium]|nr:hypothetical protein [Chloroflexota bacterium]